MKKSYESEKMWEEEYKNGYGNKWPDTELVTIYYRYIKPYIKEKKAKILDFGCGIGQNLRFFEDIGYEVYGIDISQEAVEKCLCIHPTWEGKIVCANILQETSIRELFNINFDVIISCECLYLLDDGDIKRVMKQFSDCLKQSGRFYATMHSWNSEIYDEKIPNLKKREGMIKISNLGRINVPFKVNLIVNEKELQEKFNILECEHIFKSSSNITGINMQSFHYVGRKGES